MSGCLFKIHKSARQQVFVQIASGMLVFLLSTQPTAVSADEGFTTNPFCRQHRCINPPFPGLDELPHLEANRWQCQPFDVVNSYLKFCKGAVNYDVAIPSPAVGNVTTLDMIVDHQDNAASAMYFYHISAMNLEPWDHRKPQTSSDDCTRSVWKMVCNTYFPRPEAGCTQGQPTRYLRPCKNVCQQYVHKCGVECCDGSLQCVFDHKETFGEDPAYARVWQLETGYWDEVGPHHSCTGHAARSVFPRGALALGLGILLFARHAAPVRHAAPGRPRPPWPGLPMRAPGAPGAPGAPLRRTGLRSWASLGLLLAAALSLSGCEAAAHGSAAAWLSKPSYLVSFHYVPPGRPWREAALNSCDAPGLPAQQQCSGNGFCKAYRPNAAAIPSDVPLRFCECDRDWADPECRTRRRSQKKAYLLALFAGFLGLDEFYLGEYPTGVAKLASFGGLGVWWALDVVRIGSAPVYAADFRLAADLDHGLFVFSSLAFFALIGFVLFDKVAAQFKRKRERSTFLVAEEAEFHRTRSATLPCHLQGPDGAPTKLNFGTPLPIKGYGAVTQAVRVGAEHNDLAAYYVYLEEQRSKEEEERRQGAAGANACGISGMPAAEPAGGGGTLASGREGGRQLPSGASAHSGVEQGPEPPAFRPASGIGWSPYGADGVETSSVFDVYQPPQ